jgi:hypothetical protein
MTTRLSENAGNRTINMEVDCLAWAVGRQWRELWPKVKRLERNHDAGRALSTEEENRLLVDCPGHFVTGVAAMRRVGSV